KFVTLYEIWEPKPGDLIEIFRGGYQHWAIYVGDGNVIHLGTASENTDAGACSVKSVLQDSAKVMKEKLQKVVGNDKFQIRNLLDDKCTPRPIEDILQDAESLVGKVLPYDVATHKCEHFITLLRYGMPRSQQVQLFVQEAVMAGTAILGVLAVGALVFGILAAASSEDENEEKK
uniref:LRAT domain-containing protein n=1 Tax=Cyprinus carpio TaxID=7962 RepID=A0A8C2BNC5_CYPCA